LEIRSFAEPHGLHAEGRNGAPQLRPGRKVQQRSGVFLPGPETDDDLVFGVCPAGQGRKSGRGGERERQRQGDRAGENDGQGRSAAACSFRFAGSPFQTVSGPDAPRFPPSPPLYRAGHRKKEPITEARQENRYL
jgi:hypothetical protein